LARIRAHERAEEIARAMIDDPLDDKSLSTDRRQSAVIAGLNEAFPRAQVTLETALPDTAEGFSALDWETLRALERAHPDLVHETSDDP